MTLDLAVPEIDVAALADLLPTGVAVLDVREPDEYEAGHVAGAVPIPLGSVPERVAEVPDGRPLYVICARGGRSLKAAEFLRAQGIDAVNVAGGTLAWIDAGHPVTPGTEP